ncbi:hypothetical protein M758_11G088500 [Ceratodon purpureus]|uniref:DNA-directed RNA polymerase III subunit RPC9 n=1 Tax=Ceratodon purpureus TaxID=3225 RepID=A0A8T0GFM9_CERPU|nr:hypothetical protein KC19_11G091500 [Ceratodon purpureus]KAG0601160.1 hypothetical protein M758_11G088500 [Ceratodon purpureus]
MKVKNANAGLLTNFETMDLFKSRGADKATGGMLSASEMKVYDYLEKTPAGQQTRENITRFFKATEQYKLTKAEQLQASNLRPASAVEVHLIVEDCDERLASDAVDQFLEKIEEILPPIPEPEEPAAEDDAGEGAQPEGTEMEADV